jgi:signal transduction histidine kinase
MTDTLFRELHDTLARLAGADAYSLSEPLYRELWARREDHARNLQLTATDGVGAAYVARALPASMAVAHVLAGGRALVELGESQGLLDGAGARRLGAIVDEATVQVAAAVEKARRARRQQWLSFLAHELKNPLNTVLNALWLLRERGSDKAAAARFVELAERAVKRLEARIADVRALDDQLAAAPPGWEALRAPSEAEKTQ